MTERLSRRQRLALIAELCPKYGARRACDSYELARERAVALLGLPEHAGVTADYVLMRAVDRFAAGRLGLDDLYRCRLLAYYMAFARGGEEWARWGVAADVTPGDFPGPLEPDAEPDLDDLPPPPPSGPPWREP